MTTLEDKLRMRAARRHFRRGHRGPVCLDCRVDAADPWWAKLISAWWRP